MSKPKVLVLTSSYPKYKGDNNGNFVYELAIRLKSDFDIIILAPAFKGSFKYEIWDDIEIYRHKQFCFKNVELAYGSDILAKIRKNKAYLFVVPFYLLYQLLSVRMILKKEKIQLIHAHWLIPQGFIAVLYKTFFKRNIKILVTAHGADINSFENFVGTILKKFTLKRLDALTVVSNEFKKKVSELGYKNEIYVYPMGVDTELFSPKKREESLKSKYNIHSYFLLFVGGIIERKGIRYLIQAMPGIIKKFPDVKLLVIGEGNLKNEMLGLANKLDVSGNIIFTGSIPHNDLPPYFATADVFILPSLSEGFGLVVIEAISCKTLAITSNLEPIHDIINENETGFYLEGINEVAISEKIISVLQDKEKLEIMKEKGRRHVIKNFEWNIVSNNYARLLYRLF